jgi:Flp pilus assembly protein TadB
MFFVMYYLNPHYVDDLIHTHTGIWMLAVAGAMLVVGSIAIRKITTLRV